jgi:small subunit ribosomal protein S16
LTKSKDEVRKAALAAEAKKNADRAAALAIKNAPVEEVVEETPEDQEAPAAETTDEAPAAETTEGTEEEKA